MTRSRSLRLGLAAGALTFVAASVGAPPPARAIIVEMHVASPCTLVVFEDGSSEGCDRISPSSSDGEFLSAAGEQAIAVMRAWHKLNAIRAFQTEAAADADSGRAAWRDSLLADLTPEMARTTGVDSMAVVLIADSVSFADGDLESRYWIARTVRRAGGSTSREVSWSRYAESWARGPAGWRLVGMRLLDSGSLPLGRFASSRADFPTRTRPRDVERAEVERRGMLEARLGRGVIRRSAIPADLMAGDQLGPFEGSCPGPVDDSAPFDRQPVPVTTARPVFPADVTEDEQTVILQVFVCASGKVGWIQVAEGEPPFCAAAAIAVARWSYAPATWNGEPVGVWIEVPIEFHR